MRKRNVLTIAAVAAASLALSGCGAGTDSASSKSGDDKPLFTVAENVSLDGSATFRGMSKAQKINVGVKDDQPGLGYLDAATGIRSGFDIEVAQWIAASLGFDPKKIEYTSIPSANREAALINGDIDYYVGTYSITDKRKTQIGFAGPYFETGQGLLVASSNGTITGPDSLEGKTVCSATGSTPIQNIKENFPSTKTIEFDTYSQCVEALQDGKADAVTTDEAILLGYAAQSPSELKVVGSPFTVEKYGIGLAKGDTALKGFIDDMLTKGGSTWKKIYDRTLGSTGTIVEQPSVDKS